MYMLKQYPHLLWVLFIIFLINPYLNATGSYVDQNATGNNNGTNQVDAWRSFSVSNCNLVRPGDKVYIFEKNDPAVYDETLITESPGKNGNNIEITENTSSGYNNKVVIDIQNFCCYYVNFDYSSKSMIQ